MPDSWSPYVPILGGLVRAVLAALGGIGVTWAQAVTGDQIQMTISILMIVGAAGWSTWQKIDALRKGHQASVSSATASATATTEQGQPIAVVIPPKASL